MNLAKQIAETNLKLKQLDREKYRLEQQLKLLQEIQKQTS